MDNFVLQSLLLIVYLYMYVTVLPEEKRRRDIFLLLLLLFVVIKFSFNLKKFEGTSENVYVVQAALGFGRTAVF